jgi:hypothetical protein
MRWHDLSRLYTPVTAAPLQRAQPAVVLLPEPDSGARWGKPSAFSWSRQQAIATSSETQKIALHDRDEDPVEYMRVIPAQAQVTSERVKVRAPGEDETWVEIDRLTRLMFSYTEFPSKPTTASMQPSLTTYFDLHFELHPPEADEAA